VALDWPAFARLTTADLAGGRRGAELEVDVGDHRAAGELVMAGGELGRDQEHDWASSAA
jgi:hypothetical protein